MTPMKWFLTYLKQYRPRIIFGLVLVTAMAALAIVSPNISGEIVDGVIQGGRYDELPVLILILIGATAARSVLKFCVPYNFEICSQGIIYKMRDEIYEKLLSEDFHFFDRNRTGDLMSRQTGDMEAIRNFTAATIYAVFENILYFAFALLMIFTVNTKLALGMVCILPFTALTTVLQMRAVKPAFRGIRRQFSSLNAFVQENISANRVVKAFAKEDYEMEKFEKENDAYRDAELACARVWEKYVPVFELFSNVLMVMLMLYGGYLAVAGEITVGNMVTVNGYLWMLNSPLRMAGWYINDIQRFVTSVEKIYDTFSVEPAIKNEAEKKETDRNEAAEEKNISCKTRENGPERPGTDRGALRGDVEFRHVSYRAPDGELLIRDVSFHAHRGQTIGIIGPTGSGKSILMNLLCRFYDATEGEVLVDGMDVRKADLKNLRDRIGMAMQDVFLFSDTIEGNLAYGRPDCDFETVKKAAVASVANHFIKETPYGYDTIVGERGVGLSGGQKQRISLARALVKDPEILILDDTTSAVDMETESYIQKQLKNIGRDHTVFIIAYRISSVKDADQIYVMQHGQITERGTHRELVNRGGYYAQVFAHQYGKGVTDHGEK